MYMLMTVPTKRDQVGLCVVTEGATTYGVVDIEILRVPTFLTAPAVPL